MILLLDNFDSFTYNLVDYFGQLGETCHVVRNHTPLEDICQQEYNAVVLSPGPSTPELSGNLMQVLDYYHDKLPILGICLGHQAIGSYFGASLVKAQRPMHGKCSLITHDHSFLFEDIPSPYNVVRYHSLVLEKVSAPLVVNAYTKAQEVMAISHNSLPIYGIQFHPEAIMTDFGLKLLNNWINSWKSDD
ncbi:aminodeoxychorismate/anthranilate synthase component II [Algivirga pacifica]|uniref:Aminodeoxychorismate/anthranilate synthase component II n=1 Tax=Algivirga pacifica TaxID=1162670 RepID=A0ABP9DBQ7_9BACT